MAISGFGTTIGVGATTSGPFTDIAEVLDISGFNAEVTDIETTHNDLATPWKTYIAGLVEGGEVTFGINYAKAARATLEGYIGVAKGIKITYPDGSDHTFNGYVKGLGQETPMDDRMTCPCTIKVAAKPTFTPAS